MTLATEWKFCSICFLSFYPHAFLKKGRGYCILARFSLKTSCSIGKTSCGISLSHPHDLLIPSTWPAYPIYVTSNYNNLGCFQSNSRLRPKWNVCVVSARAENDSSIAGSLYLSSPWHVCSYFQHVVHSKFTLKNQTTLWPNIFSTKLQKKFENMFWQSPKLLPTGSSFTSRQLNWLQPQKLQLEKFQ